METAPPTTTPQSASPQATVPERRGPVDLTLHGLPSGEWATTVPAAPGPIAAPQKKEWRPRGDAGDPILGKLGEKKEEAYPLESVGRDGYVYSGPAFTAHIALDGTVSFDDKNIGFVKGTSGGSFDLNDLLMKGHHQDPYRYEKQKFLSATAAKRTELARQAREEQLRQSLGELPWHCDEIWRDRRRAARERRSLLYALWKDTSDEAGGAEARAIIEKFIRRYLPAGSPDAFSDDELAELNGSKSHHFDPYH
jgi:hypothetical protein